MAACSAASADSTASRSAGSSHAASRGRSAIILRKTKAQMIAGTPSMMNIPRHEVSSIR